MKLQQRKALLVQLGEYLAGNEEEWQAVKRKAFGENNWFIPEFIDLAAGNVATEYLAEEQLDKLISKYGVPDEISSPLKVGIVMAGNIPLVGIHDLICVFLAGHIAWIKPSSKDDALTRHIVGKLVQWEPEAADHLVVSELLKNCDAYIATGSNNTSRYFDYYFRNYPSIIRKNRTSVAILDGTESREELEKLADDVYQFFGLGCCNVTKLYVPESYDFIPLLEAFRKYDYLAGHHKYKNNYDYNLAIHILNSKYYMTNGSILIVEDPSPFSPISQLHYETYVSDSEIRLRLLQDDNIQCVVGKHSIPFGGAQCPSITTYADGTDTMSFLLNLQVRS